MSIDYKTNFVIFAVSMKLIQLVTEGKLTLEGFDDIADAMSEHALTEKHTLYFKTNFKKHCREALSEKKKNENS